MQYKILKMFNKLASMFSLIHLVFLFKPAELLTAQQIQSKQKSYAKDWKELQGVKFIFGI